MIKIPAPKDPKKKEEWKRKISLGNKGKLPWNAGLERSEETRMKISITRKNRKIPAWNKGLKGEKYLDHLKNRSGWNKKEKIQLYCQYCGTPFKVHPYRKETAKFCSRSCVIYFYRSLYSHFRELDQREPTSYEEKIITLCNEYTLPFRFIGNGKLYLGNRNPDFECTINKRLLIEVYCDYFKKDSKKYEIDRREHYLKYGYNVLFLNDRDIKFKNWKDICLNKIKNFLEENENCLEKEFCILT